jgi:hypothetical protein
VRHRAAGRLAALAGILAGLMAEPAFAQSPGPPGPYVIDVRGTTSTLSKKPGFYPPLPTASLVPSRGFGVDIGGHVYAGSLGPARLGFGASVTRARATAPPVLFSEGSQASGDDFGPRIVANFTAFEPQVSFNFGTRAGWSYISGGAGVGRVATRAVEDDGVEAAMTTGWRRTINVGAGARWFMKSRLGVGFDIRLHRVLRGPITPQASSLAISAGFSVR